VNGRRQRIYVDKLGQDGHFDVNIGPSFSSRFEVGQEAINVNVHVVYVSILNGDKY